ncbi:MAG: hypothetical protein KZQ96_01975 [Candidatus Thiodiazotropha sp. (ex Lucinoma borealis)]|nr:hypothetical protein [Candidatus Thiodiazotropha sp. (ex Lucinoma borealis)]
MDGHRIISPDRLDIIDVSPPFSSFKFIEDHFDASPAVHRCFSLARAANFRTLIVEEIQEAGAVRDENQEIPEYVNGHQMTGLKRVSFWKPKFIREIALKSKTDADLVGYAILKKDKLEAGFDGRTQDDEYWHIFEAVFRKYPHKHNCVPRTRAYKVNVNGFSFELSGVLYCQQNALNKVCAHVALRSLLSRWLDEGDILYSTINKHAKKAYPTKPYSPANGLDATQIQTILDGIGVPYKDMEYEEEEKNDPNARKLYPYQKYLYAGVESGSGALLGFKLTGPKAEDSRHIIPFYGHTFNKDTWAPDADISYFDVGGGIGYIPSESWTSSFIGHDDNFGPNFCVPRLYVKPDQAIYVVELLHKGFQTSGIQAEALSLPFLYSLYPHIAPDTTNNWSMRLKREISTQSAQQVVLRAIAVSAKKYLEHLSNLYDWEGNCENPLIPSTLESLLPEWLWVVEVSMPQLFPANERKLGEVVLNPYEELDKMSPSNSKSFLFARLPGNYFIVSGDTSGEPDFLEVPSRIKTHTELLII